VQVGKFVYAFNEDGHTFIKHAARNVLETTFFNQNKISIPGKLLRKTASSSSSWSVQPRVLTIPPTINHFVMNLPATAIEFLGSFKGLYYGYEDLFEPHTKTKLPMVHVHCFLKQGEVPVNEEEQICERISASLGYVVKPGDKELVIHEVRDVAPKKKMFCASFRLPAEVAFWGPSAQEQSGLQEKSGQSNNETGTAENLVKWSAFKP
jgi:tRNA (guanine37-N1)-methyltransferase